MTPFCHALMEWRHFALKFCIKKNRACWGYPPPLLMMYFGEFWHPCRWCICPGNDNGGYLPQSSSNNHGISKGWEVNWKKKSWWQGFVYDDRGGVYLNLNTIVTKRTASTEGWGCPSASIPSMKIPMESFKDNSPLCHGHPLLVGSTNVNNAHSTPSPVDGIVFHHILRFLHSNLGLVIELPLSMFHLPCR